MNQLCQINYPNQISMTYPEPLNKQNNGKHHTNNLPYILEVRKRLEKMLKVLNSY